MQASEEDQGVEHVLLHKQAPEVHVLHDGDLGIVWARGRKERMQQREEEVGKEGKDRISELSHIVQCYYANPLQRYSPHYLLPH